jgi:hypothetical protein
MENKCLDLISGVADDPMGASASNWAGMECA